MWWITKWRWNENETKVISSESVERIYKTTTTTESKGRNERFNAKTSRAADPCRSLSSTDYLDRWRVAVVTIAFRDVWELSYGFDRDQPVYSDAVVAMSERIWSDLRKRIIRTDVMPRGIYHLLMMIEDHPMTVADEHRDRCRPSTIYDWIERNFPERTWTMDCRSDSDRGTRWSGESHWTVPMSTGMMDMWQARGIYYRLEHWKRRDPSASTGVIARASYLAGGSIISWSSIDRLVRDLSNRGLLLYSMQINR